MTQSCLFCQIVAGEIPADIVYSDADVIGFADVAPQAPHHYLFIPREHIATLNDATTKHTEILGALMQGARSLAAELGFAQNGYRLAMNCNADAGQTVFHIHLHVLAGRQLGWPPG